MGKPTGESIPNPPSISHFSHPHPLQLLNLQHLPCSACNLDSTAAAVYACVICNFALHPKCSELPQQIQHPFDPKHPLNLYPKPVYPEGQFNCDACGNRGAGFSYHCSPCGVDLHTACASLPMSLTHHCHRDPLALTFSVPYPGNRFSCDVCKRLGSKTWIYSCATCEFDAHVTCVATVVPPAPTQPQLYMATRSLAPNNPPSNVMNEGGGSGGGYRPQPGYAANGYPAGMPNQPVYYGGSARPVSGLRDQMAVAAVEGITGGIAQAATQALLQELLGGGSGGGGGGGAAMDGGSYYDGGYGGADGGGGDGSY